MCSYVKVACIFFVDIYFVLISFIYYIHVYKFLFIVIILSYFHYNDICNFAKLFRLINIY